MILALVFAVSSLAARADGGIRTERVHFAKGATSAVVSGKPQAGAASTATAAKSAHYDATGKVPCAQREGDLNMIRVGDERYEIPDAAVSGG